MPSADPARDRAPRVLVVEDSSLVRRYYHEVLSQSGFIVEQALNGIEAMEKMLAGVFDLVIVDVNMPQMDGLSFVHRLRAGAMPGAAAPVLIISTEAGADDIEKARRAGANFYLVKPIAQEVLRQHVRALVGVPQ